ncbi:protein bric-a-brac 2-like isoform X3 [Bacillus rossius redtenbacheri]|uniref:protein bric-a-brac 2-like isoform X3 n=1 Tax=Bacillus rossius redtenbacheri TaxID=93214 RepID=UPI002FDECF1C
MHGGRVVNTLASHHGDWGLISGGVEPGVLQVRNMADVAVACVFSWGTPVFLTSRILQAGRNDRTVPRSTPCKHPVVMLAGVAAADLEALLEFVYRGEVSVDPSRLPSLLQAAHCLDIQGLAPGTISAEKPDELSTTLPSTHEALTRDVINSFLPIRRRKRTKRRNSTGSGSSSAGKWPRQEGDVENIGLERRHTVGAALEAGHDALSMQEMPGLPEPEQRSHSSDEQTYCPGGGKVRGASDQPGACPVCGALLRQARNLRRHLLSSCKYRAMGPNANASSPGGGEGTCEQIVCPVSPVAIPSPLALHHDPPQA